MRQVLDVEAGRLRAASSRGRSRRSRGTGAGRRWPPTAAPARVPSWPRPGRADGWASAWARLPEVGGRRRRRHVGGTGRRGEQGGQQRHHQHDGRRHTGDRRRCDAPDDVGAARARPARAPTGRPRSPRTPLIGVHRLPGRPSARGAARRTRPRRRVQLGHGSGAGVVGSGVAVMGVGLVGIRRVARPAAHSPVLVVRSVTLSEVSRSTSGRWGVPRTPEPRRSPVRA